RCLPHGPRRAARYGIVIRAIRPLDHGMVAGAARGLPIMPRWVEWVLTHLENNNDKGFYDPELRARRYFRRRSFAE
ncbi:MAG: hypothetical protein O6763_07195, partial [Gammaproteobacteria bacterium]|nr:hypothetical protein [Gammaproteobacteria bacterium]